MALGLVHQLATEQFLGFLDPSPGATVGTTGPLRPALQRTGLRNRIEQRRQRGEIELAAGQFEAGMRPDVQARIGTTVHI